VRLPRSTAITWARLFRLAPLRNGKNKAMFSSYMVVSFLLQAVIWPRKPDAQFQQLSGQNPWLGKFQHFVRTSAVNVLKLVDFHTISRARCLAMSKNASTSGVRFPRQSAPIITPGKPARASARTFFGSALPGMPAASPIPSPLAT